MKLVDISGTKRRNIRKLKLMTVKTTVRSKISEACVGPSVTLRRVTSLELIKDEKCDLFTDTHSILARWRNHVSQLLSVHGG